MDRVATVHRPGTTAGMIGTMIAGTTTVVGTVATTGVIVIAGMIAMVGASAIAGIDPQTAMAR